MELDGSLMHSQESRSGPYPEPGEFNPQPPTLHIILP
jgi:hypothetical protein